MTLSNCPYCGASVRFVERRQTMEQGTGGHHISIYECPEHGELRAP